MTTRKQCPIRVPEALAARLKTYGSYSEGVVRLVQERDTAVQVALSLYGFYAIKAEAGDIRVAQSDELFFEEIRRQLRGIKTD
jgi:hypothetical protein